MLIFYSHLSLAYFSGLKWILARQIGPEMRHIARRNDNNEYYDNNEQYFLIININYDSPLTETTGLIQTWLYRHVVPK